MSQRCVNCFREYDEKLELCPYCGYVPGKDSREPCALVQGTVLKERYCIGQVIGVGGFGITYKAWDQKLEVVVAIKEYYPRGLVNRVPGTKDVVLYAVNRKSIFEHGLTRFLDEARNMAKFNSEKNIINVYEYFEENGTAYIAMEYLDGLPLDRFLQNNRVTVKQSLDIIFAVGSALKQIHRQGIIHRDISPDNIFMCKNGDVKLLDFGAARFSLNEDQHLTIIVKPGYAPPEQYETINQQGPWTDVYALGATLYLMLTGQKPDESTNRKISDTVPAPHQLNPDISINISNSVMKAMAIDIHMRFHSVEEFEEGLRNERRVLSVQQEKKKKKRRRNMGVIAALSMIAIGAVFFFVSWETEKAEETLPDATLTVWCRLSGDEALDEQKINAYTEIVEEFRQSFPNVTVNLESYQEEEYAAHLEQACAEGNMPNMYESEGISEELLSNAIALGSVAKTEEAAACYFLDAYENYFPDQKQMPLGFSLPAVYINNTLTDVKLNSVSDIVQLAAEADTWVYALDFRWKSDYEGVLGEEFLANNTFENVDSFYQGETICLLGSTTDYRKVQESLPARYDMIALEGEGVQGQFGDLWSINDGTRQENKAAARLLQYMLCENSQDQMHVRNESEYLPLNKNTLEILESVYLDYSGFFDHLSSITF